MIAGSKVAVSAMFEYTAVIGALEESLPLEEQLATNTPTDNKATSLNSLLRTSFYLSSLILFLFILLWL